MKRIKDAPNHLPDFDFVRFLPTQVVGTTGNPRESPDEKSSAYKILPCMCRGKPAEFSSWDTRRRSDWQMRASLWCASWQRCRHIRYTDILLDLEYQGKAALQSVNTVQV